MTHRIFVWPAILAALALLIASVLLLVIQPRDETPGEPRVPATAEAERIPPRDTELRGFGSVGSPSSASGFPPARAPGSTFGIADDGAEREMLPWEIAINQLLDSEDENSKVAADLAALLPTLPPDGQVEAVQHMVNLLEDDKYSLASNMLLNPAIHPDLRGVIWSDVLDRPNNVKMPVLLGLMSVPGHPSRGEAHLKLQEALGADFGGDAALWSAPVQAFLAREAEEEAKAEEEAALEVKDKESASQ